MNVRSTWTLLSAACVVALTATCMIGPPPAVPGPVYYAPPLPPPGAAQPPVVAAPPVPRTSETIIDERGKSIVLEHGPEGDPAVIGCADGRREAFLDSTRYPNIAGCLGTWPGRQSLREPKTGRRCGDEAGPCAVPADVCAPGWRVCGSTGAVQDLRQVGPEDCRYAGGGRFAAGISHCKTQQGCSLDESADASYGCFPHGWCSEPVCCGRDCGDFGICRDGVWRGQTHIPFGQDQGCGSTEARRAGGVLCCRN